MAEYDYSSTQVNLPRTEAAKIEKFLKDIPREDLDPDETLDEPHITVKYGLHTADPTEVRDVLAGEPPVRVKFGTVSLFENEDKPYDVVKVDVLSDDLDRLNKKISKALKTTDTFPEYHPHVTIAYVKKGRGKKYVGQSPLDKDVEFDTVQFSSKAGHKTPISLSGDAVESAIHRSLEESDDDQ